MECISGKGVDQQIHMKRLLHTTHPFLCRIRITAFHFKFDRTVSLNMGCLRLRQSGSCLTKSRCEERMTLCEQGPLKSRSPVMILFQRCAEDAPFEDVTDSSAACS